jgi:hypothetical protein
MYGNIILVNRTASLNSSGLFKKPGAVTATKKNENKNPAKERNKRIKNNAVKTVLNRSSESALLFLAKLSE